MNTQKKLIIPGKLIGDNMTAQVGDNTVGVSLGAIKVLNHPTTPQAVVNRINSGLKDKNFINKVFLHPIVVSFYTQGSVSSFISVDIFGLFPSDWFDKATSYTDEEKDSIFKSFFTLQYDLVLGFDSDYELVVYVSFEQPTAVNPPTDLLTSDKNLFDLLQFPIEFSSEAFDDFFSSSVENSSLINKIKTVKVFVVNQAGQTEYEKQFKATTVSIQNCPPPSTSENFNSLAIPGIPLELQSLSNQSPDLPYVSFIDSANPPTNNNFPILPVTDFLLSPLVVASHLDSTKSGGESLEILVGALLQQSLGIINPSEFSFFYKIVLNNSTIVDPPSSNPSGNSIIKSNYKMNLYVTFNKEELKGSTNVLDAFYFAGKFGQYIELFNGDANIDSLQISTEDITSVEVFIVNKDPETSRGTETVVQGT